mgnify:CR=1 FL=1
MRRSFALSSKVLQRSDDAAAWWSTPAEVLLLWPAGEAEAWMNERLSRATPGCVAEYITAFKESSVSDEEEASGSGLLSGILKKEQSISIL